MTTPHFTNEIDDILKQVWEEYGRYTSDELESITHQEKPWQEARKNVSPLDASSAPINDQTIFDYYIMQTVINE